MILLTRHGQTDWNIQRKAQGRTDVPLNEVGIKQAEKLRDDLLDTNIDVIFYSPLQRAKKTAEIVNEGRNIPMICDDRLVERDFGEFEGNDYNKLDHEMFWDYYQNVHYKSAENIQVIFKRVYSFFDEILNKYNGKDVLVVTHGGVCRVAYFYFNNTIPKGSLYTICPKMENCEVVKYDNK